MAVVASTESSVRPAVQPRAIVFAGLVALAVAMGIGRFAFTPLLPMMLHDGVVNLPAASWLASANYFGYLVGALLCTFQPWIWARAPWLPTVRHTTWVRGGLVATCLLTAAMAVQWPGVWPTLRFAAGVASAVTFVFTSGWCLARLAALGQPAWAGAIYIGPGAGIAVTGLMVSGMVALDWRAATGWAVFGVLAAALVARVWPIFGGPAPVAAASATTAAAANTPQQRSHAGEKALLALAYGLAGFGYIITATFLPVIARDVLPGSFWLDLFWPILGVGVMVGAFLSTRIPLHLDRRMLLAACYLMQAAGIAASAWSPTVVGLFLGSLLVGLPFTAITFFAMQEARRLVVVAPASFMGLITATYGAGQIAGPLMVPWVLQHTSSRAQGFTVSLEVAAAVLVVGALVYVFMAWRYPLRQR
ncbi:MAG: YbfB/YjiJ family MFS transporter [Xylophilus sp.]|nr:YbfB/YjiJ family MFS transporter [Xylophilus sp.]